MANTVMKIISYPKNQKTICIYPPTSELPSCNYKTCTTKCCVCVKVGLSCISYCKVTNTCKSKFKDWCISHFSNILFITSYERNYFLRNNDMQLTSIREKKKQFTVDLVTLIQYRLQYWANIEGKTDCRSGQCRPDFQFIFL